VSRKTKNQQATGLGGDFVPSRLRPIDIQQQEFGTSFRGYVPTEVDAFLDRLTEDYATLHEENKRLKEGGPLLAPSGAAAADVDGIIRQAHAQADAILNEARTRAAAVAGGGASGGEDALSSVWPFLAKEREFLRGLAAYVQEHAEGVKRHAKQLQATSKQATSVASPTSGAVPTRPLIDPKPAASAGSPPSPTTSARAAASPPPARPSAAPGESAWTQTAGDASRPVVKIPPSPVDTPPADAGALKPRESDVGETGAEPTLRELFWNEEG